MRDKLFTCIPSIFNLATIVVFIPAFILGSIGILQNIWIVLALVITIPDMVMSYLLIRYNTKFKKFGIINLIIAAIFFLFSIIILLYVLIT